MVLAAHGTAFEGVLLLLAFPAGLFVVALIVTAIQRECESPEKRQARLLAAEEDRVARTTAEGQLGAFLEETRPYVTYAPKHPEAALFRSAWRRALVLEELLSRRGESGKAKVYHSLQELLSRKYSAVAPSNAYGPVRLVLTPDQRLRIVEQEMERLNPRPLAATVPKPTACNHPSKPFACIYLGFDRETGRAYVGQTVNEPELRWVQHRRDRTGPFKDDASYAEWSVIKQNVPLDTLDYWESFYIGYHGAYPEGHNAIRGPDPRAYHLGCERRIRDCSTDVSRSDLDEALDGPDPLAAA